MSDQDYIVPYDELDTADLHVDRVYAGSKSNGRSLDAVSRLFGVGVRGGIRFRGSAAKDSVQLVVLYSTGDNPDWRDYLDAQSGMLTYYGDNRHPGKGLLDTHLNGNTAFKNAFSASRDSRVGRSKVSPFFYFELVKKEGSLVRFRGLAAPGGEAMTSSEELSAPWWTRDGQRFQNYCAKFTILDAPVIRHSWIDELLAGEILGDSCPDAWREWVESRTYRTLTATSTDPVRSRDKQLPSDVAGNEILEAIGNHFSGGADFHAFALSVWRMIAPDTKSAVGEGRLLIERAKYSVGPTSDRIEVDFVLDTDGGVVHAPVADVSRLLSRLRYREFGAFITLSYFADHIYDEVRSDGHPVALICGKDVVETLRRRGYSDVQSIQVWLDGSFPRDVPVK